MNGLVLERYTKLYNRQKVSTSYDLYLVIESMIKVKLTTIWLILTLGTNLHSY